MRNKKQIPSFCAQGNQLSRNLRDAIELNIKWCDDAIALGEHARNCKTCCVALAWRFAELMIFDLLNRQMSRQRQGRR